MQRANEIHASIIHSASTLSSSLSTSLGPRGSDKMIIKDKTTLITNDGATILKSLRYNHPINTILANVSQTQDSQCGDGTTSVVILTGSILKRCQNLLNKKVHVARICRALERIKIIGNDYIESVKMHIGDVRLSQERFRLYINEPLRQESPAVEGDFFKYRDSLLKSVVTALSSKVIALNVLEYAPIAVDAVLMVKGSVKCIKVVKKVGGCIEDVKLERAIVLSENVKNKKLKELLIKQNVDNNTITDDKKSKTINNENTNIENNYFSKSVKLAVLQFCISPPKTNIDSKININDTKLMEKIIKEEREYLLDICKKVKKSGAEVIVVQKSILRESVNDLALHFLTKLNILVIDDVSREDIKFICEKLDLNPSVDPDAIETKECLLEENLESEALITRIICDKGCSVIVRGCDKLIVDEAERSLNDALCVVKCLFEDPFLVPGGGAIEIGISEKLCEECNSAKKEDNHNFSEGYIFYELSKAFEEIPFYLSRNAGMDSVNVVNELKNKITENPYLGINVRTNSISSMLEENIVQPSKVSKSVVSLAIETVSMILKIDDILPSNK
ncbi:T-complex protein 1 subunit delta [Conglomerata obtusa]